MKLSYDPAANVAYVRFRERTGDIVASYPFTKLVIFDALNGERRGLHLRSTTPALVGASLPRDGKRCAFWFSLMGLLGI